MEYNIKLVSSEIFLIQLVHNIKNIVAVLKKIERTPITYYF